MIDDVSMVSIDTARRQDTTMFMCPVEQLFPAPGGIVIGRVCLFVCLSVCLLFRSFVRSLILVGSFVTLAVKSTTPEFY